MMSSMAVIMELERGRGRPVKESTPDVVIRALQLRAQGLYWREVLEEIVAEGWRPERSDTWKHDQLQMLVWYWRARVTDEELARHVTPPGM